LDESGQSLASSAADGRTFDLREVYASVAQQLDWCQVGGVDRAVFTHCGSGVVRLTGADASRMVRALAGEQGIGARLARDGLTMSVRGSWR